MTRAAALLLLAGAAHADPALIRTHAEAHQPVDNSVAEIELGVAAEGLDAAAAAGTLASRATTLLAYLRAQPAVGVRQDAVSVEPVTVYAPGEAPRVTGFAARTMLSFRADPAAMGPMLSGALANGASEIQALRLAPSDDAITGARASLLAAATRAAIAQAATVAEAAHLRVTAIRSITMDQAAPPPVRPMALRAARTDAMPAIEAGTSELTASVAVEVEAQP